MQKLCLSYARNDILPESDCKGELWWLAENFSYCHSYVTSWQISESQRVLLQHSFLKSISPLYWQRPWTHTHKKSKKKNQPLSDGGFSQIVALKACFFCFLFFFSARQLRHHTTPPWTEEAVYCHMTQQTHHHPHTIWPTQPTNGLPFLLLCQETKQIERRKSRLTRMCVMQWGGADAA